MGLQHDYDYYHHHHHHHHHCCCHGVYGQCKAPCSLVRKGATCVFCIIHHHHQHHHHRCCCHGVYGQCKAPCSLVRKGATWIFCIIHHRHCHQYHHPYHQHCLCCCWWWSCCCCCYLGGLFGLEHDGWLTIKAQFAVPGVHLRDIALGEKQFNYWATQVSTKSTKEPLFNQFQSGIFRLLNYYTVT